VQDDGEAETLLSLAFEKRNLRHAQTMVAEFRYRRMLMEARMRKFQLIKARKKLEVAQRAINDVTERVRKINQNINPSAVARRQRREHYKSPSMALDLASNYE
jgi:hypothetical protein